ncbi:hypothetical protein AB1L88_08910 [Tautonia sp. JC769]|uniref:hypothetical protein n=1 Tax=Tautonia sp. JC769 TaxID=3232135 RepID=UPI003459CC89
MSGTEAMTESRPVPITDPDARKTITMETLDGRLDRMERSNADLRRTLGRWRLAGGSALIAAAFVALAGAAGHAEKTVEAEQFVLVAPDGTPVGRWVVRPDGTPGLGLFDADGRLRLSLDLGADGSSGVNLYDSDGGPQRAALAVRPDGTPGLGLFDERGRPRASVDLGEGGDAGVNLYDASGEALRAALAIRADGTPALGLFDDRGEVARSIEIPGDVGAGRVPPHPPTAPGPGPGPVGS